MTETEPPDVEPDLDSTTPDPGPTPDERAVACRAAIRDVLALHGCIIVPYLTSQPVGAGAISQALIGASYAIETIAADRT